MQSVPAKKKKKYVLMKPQASSEQPSTRSRASSPTSALSRSRFDYTFDQILNHIFAKLLPDGNFIIRFSERLVFGREEDLDRLIDQLDENVRYYSCFLIELEEDFEKEDIEYLLEEQYRAKLFGYRFTQKCIVDFFKGTCYQLQCDAFLKILQADGDRHERFFVRMSRTYVEQFLQRVKEKARVVRESSVSDRAVPRGNRRELRTECARVTLDGAEFDVKNWKEFLQRSEKLDKKDIEIIENKNPYGYTETWTVRLLCHEGEETRKTEAFNYYFKHQNFIALPLKDSQRKTDLLAKYGTFCKNWLEMRVIRGFRSVKWDQKTLLYKLRCGQVPVKRSNFAGQPLEAILLIGLLPKVREYLEILQKEINTVPMDDVKVELYLELEDEVRDALRDNGKAEKLLEDFIRGYVGRFDEVCELTGVRFPVRGVRVELLVRAGREEEFRKSIQVQLESTMMKEISVRHFELDFPIDEEFLARLAKQGVLVVRSKDHTVFFLSSNDSLADALTAIQAAQLDFQALDEEAIQCRGRARLAHYQELIREVRQTSDYNQIFVTDPESKDRINFRIAFIGPRKKNSLFAKAVRQRVAQFQATLGSYSEGVEPQVAKFLIDDYAVQEMLVKRFRVSMVVDPSVKIEALLEIQPLAISKKVSVIRANSLSRVPFGSTVYFSRRELLDCFRQGFLAKLKMNAKRAKLGEFIKDTDLARKLTLFFKQKANPIELLSKALEEQKEDSFTIILPLTQKQRFLRQVLTILTNQKSYQGKKYSITLIDTDLSADIRTMVALPDHSSLFATQQVMVEWFCERMPYSSTGNDKLNDAVANGSVKCLLSIDDLTQVNGRTARTHTCNLKQKTLRNIKTGEEVPLVEQNGLFTFTYKNYDFQFTQQQENLVKYYGKQDMSWFYLSLAYYELDLSALTQTNLFTGKQRKVQRRERVLAMCSGEYGGKVRAGYEVAGPQIVFSFEVEDAKHLGPAIEEVSNYLEAKRVRQAIQLKPLSSALRGKLQEIIAAKARENQLECRYDSQLNQAVAVSLDQREVDRFQKDIEREVEYLLSLERMASTRIAKEEVFVFPDSWQQQKGEIQKFPVSAASQEFKEVQARFAIAPIILLQRIQNKVLFKKYLGELEHLTYLNGGQRPREMQLFHGTGDTDPELIWGDREGGFNINYSSDRNMLGRGVYFAEKAQYSHSYRHKAANGSSMFLCTVVVGESQEMKMCGSNAQVKDTGLKKNGLKYESMRGKHDICDIYVVYKDKRAYPNYLIHYQG